MKDRQGKCGAFMTKGLKSVAPTAFSPYVVAEMFVIMAAGALLGSLLVNEYTGLAWDTTQEVLKSALLICLLPVTLFGALLTPLRLSQCVVVTTRVIFIGILIGVVVAGLTDASSGGFYVMLMLALAYIFFSILRDVRLILLDVWGPATASLITITLVIQVCGITGGHLVGDVLLPESVTVRAFNIAFVLLEVLFLELIVYLWYKAHVSSYRRFPRQVAVVTSESGGSEKQVKYRNLFVNSAQCVQIQNRSHLFLSFSLLLVVIAIELYLAALLYEDWEDSLAAGLVLFMKLVTPIVLFLGLIYTSANYTKDEKVALALLASLPVFFVVVAIGNSLVTEDSTREVGYLVKYCTPGTLFYWVCMLFMYRHNKQCYQLVTPILCPAVFIPFVVIYLLFSHDAVSTSELGVIIALGQFIGVFLFLCFWLAETCATLSAHCHLLWYRTKHLQHYDSVQFLYATIWFALSFLYVDRCLTLSSAKAKAILTALIVLLYLALMISLLLQQASFQSKGDERLSFIEVLVGRTPQTVERMNLARKKRAFQAILYCGMAVLAVPMLFCIFWYLDVGYLTILFLSVFFGGLTILFLGVVGLEAKYGLRNFGERGMSISLAVLWLLIFAPLLGVVPLLYLFGVDSEVLVLVLSCSIFAVILLVGTLVSLILNMLFLALEEEDLINYCSTHLFSYLYSVAVSASEDVLRGLVKKFRELGKEDLKALMFKQSYVDEHLLEDDDTYDKMIVFCEDPHALLPRTHAIKAKEPEEGEKHWLGKLFQGCFKLPPEPQESEESLKDIVVVQDLGQVEQELSARRAQRQQETPRRADLGDDDGLEAEQLGEEQLIGDIDLDEFIGEECLQVLRWSDRLRQIWYQSLFDLFAHGDFYTDHRYLTMFDLREFIEAAGLDLIIKTFRADLIYIKLTTKFTPSKVWKSYKRIEYVPFYYGLLPELAKWTYPDLPPPVQLQFLFEYYIFPNIILRIPEMRRITQDLVREGEASPALFPLLEELYEQPSPDSEYQFKGNRPSEARRHQTRLTRADPELKLSESSGSSQRNKQGETSPQKDTVFQDLPYQDTLYRDTLQQDSPIRKLPEFGSLGPSNKFALSPKEATASTMMWKRLPTGIRQSCCAKFTQALKAAFSFRPSEQSEAEYAPPSQTDKVQWDDLCMNIPELLEKMINKWALDRHMMPFASLKCTLPNLLAIMSHIIEVLLYCLVAFNPVIQWIYLFDPLQVLHSILFQHQPDWLSYFLSALVIVVLSSLIMLSVKKRVEQGRLGLDTDRSKVTCVSLECLMIVLFSLLSMTLYLCVMKTILSVFSCQLHSGDWVLVNDSDVDCYHDSHSLYLTLGVFAFLFYYPSSTTAYPISMIQNRSLDLKFTSTFLIVEAQCKTLIAGTLTFFHEPEYVIVHLTVTGLVCLGLLIYSYKTSPCLVESYNRWKTWGYAIPLWVMFCGGLNYYSGYEVVSFVLAVIGVVGILLTVAIEHCISSSKTTTKIQPFTQSTIREFSISK